MPFVSENVIYQAPENTIYELSSQELLEKYFELSEYLYNEETIPGASTAVNERSIILSSIPAWMDEEDQPEDTRCMSINLIQNSDEIEIYYSIGVSPAIYQEPIRLPKYRLLDRSIIPDFEIKSIIYQRGFESIDYTIPQISI